MKSVLWVSHRIRRIRNRTSNEEIIEKKRLKIKVKMKEINEEENANDDDDESKKGRKMMVFIKVENIHFNPSGKFPFKSDSFSCNLVQNYNLVRKLIPN